MMNIHFKFGFNYLDIEKLSGQQTLDIVEKYIELFENCCDRINQLLMQNSTSLNGHSIDGNTFREIIRF